MRKLIKTIAFITVFILMLSSVAFAENNNKRRNYKLEMECGFLPITQEEILKTKIIVIKTRTTTNKLKIQNLTGIVLPVPVKAQTPKAQTPKAVPLVPKLTQSIEIFQGVY